MTDSPSGSRGRRWGELAVAVAAIGGVTAAFRLIGVTNPTIAAVTYLLVVLLIATASTLWVAVFASVVADIFLNYFFIPPVGTWAIENPQNVVAVCAFLVVSVVASDLSTRARDRARAQMALLEERKAAELARQSEELKTALLAALAHDLRTPLTAIRVAASNLQASWLDERDRREQSDVILLEVERLNRLFANILDMARLDSGAVLAEARWVHPSEILEAARDQVDHALRGHPVNVTVDQDAAVRLDPRLTASALAHLLENAGQYSPAGSPVSIAVSVANGEIQMTVRDRGPGLTSDDLRHVFERFYRGVAAGRRRTGTGMGLAIARGMVAAQGGRIWAENCDGGGARFTIAVPAETQVAASMKGDQTTRAERRGAGGAPLAEQAGARRGAPATNQ
jgi:K+-sensing histidine kinase KdpD